jgi:drug/metabolite transporter (DMT)-like permease
VQIRVTLAAFLLALLFGLFAPRLLRIRPKDLGYFLLVGGVVMASVQVSYFYAISKIQVVAAILLQYTAPLMVAFYSICFWGERATAYTFLALILSLFGCYLVVGGYNLDMLRMNLVGVIVAQASAACFTAYTLLGERGMHRYPPWTVVFYALVFAALSWNLLQTPFAFLSAGHDARQWAYMLYVTVPGTVLAFGLYFVGVDHLRSTRASITSTFEPISAGAIAYLFLGETLERLQIAGGILVIGAIVLLQIGRETQELAPESIRRTAQQDGKTVCDQAQATE